MDRKQNYIILCRKQLDLYTHTPIRYKPVKTSKGVIKEVSYINSELNN